MFVYIVLATEKKEAKPDIDVGLGETSKRFPYIDNHESILHMIQQARDIRDT